MIQRGEGKSREKQYRKRFEVIIAENFPKLMMNAKPQIQEAGEYQLWKILYIMHAILNLHKIKTKS